MRIVAGFIHDCIQLTIKMEKSLGLVDKKSLLKEFKVLLGSDKWKTDIEDIRDRVEKWACHFPMPGFPGAYVPVDR